jgi:hypothetical protein
LVALVFFFFEAALFVRDDTTVYVCTYPFLSSLHLAMLSVCVGGGGGTAAGEGVPGGHSLALVLFVAFSFFLLLFTSVLFFFVDLPISPPF